MKEDRSILDHLIREVISFQLYKSGKKPLDGIDPSTRIKRSVWRDEGIDLDNLVRYRIVSSLPENTGILFEIGEAEVKEGLFRKRRVHRIIKGLRPLREVLELPGSETDDIDTLSTMSGSDLLYPAMMSKASERLRASLSGLSPGRLRQSANVAISPGSIFDLSRSKTGPKESSSDLLPLFSRTVSRENWIMARGAGVIKDLDGLVRSVMEMKNGELEIMISGGELVKFARAGLASPRLEGLLFDISRTPSGEPESAENFRKRLGRVLLGSDASERVFNDITLPLLSKFRTCSRGEAMKLEKVIGPLMDPRSTPELKDLVFNSPSHNRTFIIRLMARTGDTALAETLTSLSRFSSVEEDRKEAERALGEMGLSGHPEGGATSNIYRNDK